MSRLAVYGGALVDVLRLRPGDVELAVVAHSLSQQVRWTGHTRRPVTIIEHSILVAWRLAARLGAYRGGESVLGADEWRAVAAALLHDAAEAYLTDVPSPLKPITQIGGQSYSSLEREVLESIASAFSLYYPGAQLYYADFAGAELRVADAEVTATEARDLITGSEAWVASIGAPIFGWDLGLVPPRAAYAREVWLDTLRDLGHALAGAPTTAWAGRLDTFARVTGGPR